MALKKSQLYSSLWQSCDELRGGMSCTNARQNRDPVEQGGPSFHLAMTFDDGSDIPHDECPFISNRIVQQVLAVAGDQDLL